MPFDVILVWGKPDLALDGAGNLAYLTPSRVSFDITKEHWPDIDFRDTRED